MNETSLDDTLQSIILKQLENLSIEEFDNKDDFEFDNNEKDSNSDGEIGNSFEDFTSSDNVNDIFIPACSKLSQILNERGCQTIHLSHLDVDLDTRSLPIDVLETWAGSVLQSVSEIIESLRNQQNATFDASISSHRGDGSYAAMQSKLENLQLKLFESEKRERLLTSKINEQDHDKDSNLKLSKSQNSDFKKITKNFELQIQESERRVRQRDIEIERLRGKLSSISNKEKGVSSQHRTTLSTYKNRPINEYDSKSLSNPRKDTSVKKSSSSDIIEALEAQRDGLLSRNAELDGQIIDMTECLRTYENGIVVNGNSFANEIKNDGEEVSATLKKLYSKVSDQRTTIDQLTTRCNNYKVQQNNAESIIEQLRQKNGIKDDELENLKLELNARPTVRQWKNKIAEFEEMEGKVHDLVMMRGNTAEINGWRKHLETSERIKIDKRNHDLGLWLLESLPKTVMKEVLQTICRELDVSDVSEIQPCLVKLKSVVKAVPRMERFIIQVCNFIHQRDKVSPNSIHTDSPGRPTMERVFPVLKDWWEHVKRNENLESFQVLVLRELHRRENLLSKTYNPNNAEFDENEEDDIFNSLLGYKNSDDNLVHQIKSAENDHRLDRIIHNSSKVIRELVDFQVSVFHQNKSFLAADDFVANNPEVLINKVLSHIQYLFGVKSLHGVLPMVNKAYIKMEEFKNFLNLIRNATGLVEASDTLVLSELHRRLSIS